MAEDKDKGTSSRRTMAPAATDPAGADDKAVTPASRPEQREPYAWLETSGDDELDELEAAVKSERQRRGRTPREPSFGMSEGERDELERTGRTVSPFTGEKRGDWPEERRR